MKKHITIILGLFLILAPNLSYAKESNPFEKGSWGYKNMVKNISNDCLSAMEQKYGRNDLLIKDYCDCVGRVIISNVSRKQAKQYIANGDMSWVTENAPQANKTCQ